MISSTGAREPILTKAAVQEGHEGAAVAPDRRHRHRRAARRRARRSASFDGVYLYDIDDLEKVVAANLAERAKAAEQAGKIVEHEAGQFEHWMRTQGVVPDDPRAAREVRAGRRCRGAEGRSTSSRARSTRRRSSARSIQRLVQLVVNKLLHQPTTALREARADEAALRAEVLCELFGLDARVDESREVAARRLRRVRAQSPSSRPKREASHVTRSIVIATRGSALALWQAEHVEGAPRAPCSPASRSRST